MRVKGKAINETGRYRGTDKSGKTVYWTQDEQEVDLSDEGYFQVKGDPTIVIVDLETPPVNPNAPRPGTTAQVDDKTAADMSPQVRAALGYAVSGAGAAEKAGSGSNVGGTITIPENGGTGPSVAPAGATEPKPSTTPVESTAASSGSSSGSGSSKK